MTVDVRHSLGLLLIAAVIGLPLTFTDGGEGAAAAIGFLVLLVCGGAGILGLLYAAFRPRKLGKF